MQGHLCRWFPAWRKLEQEEQNVLLRFIYAFLSLSFPAWMVLSELLWPPATLLKGAGHALVVVGTIFAVFAVYLGSVHARLLYSWDEWHQYWNNAR